MIPQVDGAYSEEEEDISDNDESSTHSNSAEEINSDLDHNCARLLISNARSLLPKEGSLVDAFQLLDLHCAGITETWFRGGERLRQRLEDLEDGKGIKVIHKSRDGRKKAGGGGVAIAFNKSTCNFKRRGLTRATGEQEIICAAGRIGKLNKQVVVFVVYVPPGLNAAGVAALKETMIHEISTVRAAIKDPVIYVGGDFNRRDFSAELALAGDLILLATGPTRGAVAQDAIYTNESMDIRVLPPLHSDSGAVSDHKCLFIEARFRKERNYNWVVKMRRLRSQEKEAAFARELAGWDWSTLRAASDVDNMTLELEGAIASLTEKHFPLTRVRRRSNEDPWITRGIRRLWKKKIRYYKQAGKSKKWWAAEEKLQLAISKSKEEFVEKLLLEGSNGRSFYAATKKLASAASSQPWSVTDLYVGMRPGEVCWEVLSFYSGINNADAPPLPPIARIPGGLGDFSLERTAEILKGVEEDRLHGQRGPFTTPDTGICGRICGTCQGHLQQDQ